MWQRILLRLTLALGVTTAIGWCFGSTLVDYASPLVRALVEGLQPNNAVFLTVSPTARQDGSKALDIKTFLVNRVHLGNGVFLRSGSWLPSMTVDANHLVVPAIIVWTIVLGWPMRDRRTRIRSLVFALMASLCVSIIVAAVLIAGKIDILILEGAEKAHLKASETLLIWATIFFEVGGSWVVAFAVSVFGISRLIKGATRISNERREPTCYPEPFRG